MSFRITISVAFIISFFLGISGKTVGQVTVVGHMTAEVVESAHASSKIISGSEARNGQVNPEMLDPNGIYRKGEVMNFGAVAITAGENIACTIKLHETTLSDNMGNHFTIEPASVISGSKDTVRADGSQTILLNGLSSKNGFSAGVYKGSYTVVVLYN